MFKKTQSISLKDTCTPLGNNFTVIIDAKRNVGHYAVVSRNIVTVSSSALEGSSDTKPVNRPFVLRDPNAQRISHIVQVSSVFFSFSYEYFTNSKRRWKITVACLVATHLVTIL